MHIPNQATGTSRPIYTTTVNERIFPNLALRNLGIGMQGQECYWWCYDGARAWGHSKSSANRICENMCNISMPAPQYMGFTYL